VQIPNALRALAAEPPLAALLLDVDGTLAPIVPRPEDAVVPDETRVELRRLQSRYGLLACVSGRTGTDAARVVGVPDLTIVGEHGLELAPEADAWAERIAAFADAESRPAERKRLTVSYHWRGDADEDTAVRELEQVAARAAAAGFVPRWGRKVMEVRPPVSADKGTAVRTLLERHQLTRALYAGDDTTDLDAFRALDGLDLAVRVAVASPESPPGLREAADVVLGSPVELLTILRLL
jgi:trehalose 6-phosphate phosphatase